MGHAIPIGTVLVSVCLRGRFKGCSFLLLKLCIHLLRGFWLLLQKCTIHFLSLFFFLNPNQLTCSFGIPTPAVSMHPDKGSFQEKGLVWLTVRGYGPSWGKAMFPCFFLCSSAPLFLFLQFRARVQGMAVQPFMLDLPVSRYLKKLILHRRAMSMQKHVYIPLKIPGVSSLLLS